MIDNRKKILETMEEVLQAKVNQLKNEAFNDPVIEYLNCQTTLLADLLEKYQGEARLTSDFNHAFQELYDRKEVLKAKIALRVKEKRDYVRELIDVEGELRSVKNELFFLDKRNFR